MRLLEKALVVEINLCWAFPSFHKDFGILPIKFSMLKPAQYVLSNS